jgi:hypothetical protein
VSVKTVIKVYLIHQRCGLVAFQIVSAGYKFEGRIPQLEALGTIDVSIGLGAARFFSMTSFKLWFDRF